MNYTDYAVLFNAFGKVVGLILTVLVAILTPKIDAWLAAQVGKEKAQKLIETIRFVVEAAEQIFRDADHDGSLRKNFVRERLTLSGIEYNEQIDAIVEGLVYELNRDKREESKSIESGLDPEEIAEATADGAATN